MVGVASKVFDLSNRMRLSLFKGADYENRRVILSLLPRTAIKVLDCGCSGGQLSMAVAERTGASEVWGIDIHDEALDTASQKGIIVRHADLNMKMPLPDNTFDLVISNQLIEHLTDTDTFLSEVTRVLTPQGVAIISAPNLSSWHNVFFLALGFQPWSIDVSLAARVGNPLVRTNLMARAQGEQLGHYRPFTLQALKELMRWHGLQVERAVGGGYYPFPAPICRLPCLLDPRHSVYGTVKAIKSSESQVRHNASLSQIQTQAVRNSLSSKISHSCRRHVL